MAKKIEEPVIAVKAPVKPVAPVEKAPEPVVEVPVVKARVFTADDKLAALCKYLGVNFKINDGKILVVK